MEWTVMETGKHAGKSLPQVLFRDADWFFHAYENGYFGEAQVLEADEIYRRARSIRVPAKNGQKMLVEYIIHCTGKNRSGKFGTMRLVPGGPSFGHLNVSPSIDFFEPKSLAPYDKTGYKNFVSALKAILFGNPSRRMNRQACEDFFNDDDNFDLD